MTLNKPIPKESEPINHEKLFESFIRSEDFEKNHIIKLKEKISKGLNRIPALKFDLLEFNDPELLTLFKKDFDSYLECLQDKIFEMLCFEPEIEKIIEERNIKSDEIHIIIESNAIPEYIPIVSNFSKNLVKHIDKLVKINGRFMNQGIDKPVYHRKIRFVCNVCLTEFEVPYIYGKIHDKFNGPNFCIKGKCKSKDFQKVKWSNPYEVGFFSIQDENFKNRNNAMECFIYRNIEYFIEKTENINLNEEVEILGVIRLDENQLNKANELPSYYIEVYDIHPKKSKIVDKKIVEKINEKINNDSFYMDKLIDSVHPFTYLTDTFFPSKLVNSLSFITGGSWNNEADVRDTINSIKGGPKNTYKSSLDRAFKRKVGSRSLLHYEESKGITKAGLIGTTERNNQRSTPDIRYGVLLMFSDGTIIIDEAQKLKSEIRNQFQGLESGKAGIMQDGVNVQDDSFASLIFSMNFCINPDGSYNSEEELLKNLGWEDNSEPLLDRFDLLYVIPPLDVPTRLRVDKNEEKLSKGILLEEIAEDLDLEVYPFPQYINNLAEKIDYLHFNYFHKAKELYRESNVSAELQDEIRKIYREFLKDDNLYKAEKAINERTKRVWFKVLRALSALRLDTIALDIDYNYMRKNCFDLIISIRDSNLIERKEINLSECFRSVFNLDFARHEIESFDLKELVENLKAYLKRHYYNDETEVKFNDEIINILGVADNLSNYTLKKLLEDNSDFIEEKGYKIVSKRGKGNITTIDKIKD